MTPCSLVRVTQPWPKPLSWLLLWQPAATMAAAPRQAPQELRADRARNECTTASDIVGRLGFRVRRIKTFESVRAAKFHFAAVSRRPGGEPAGLCSEYCPRRAAPRGWPPP